MSAGLIDWTGEGTVSDYALARMRGQISGSVHSVFSSSLNVSLPGLLLHLGLTRDGLSVLGIGLPEECLHSLLGCAQVGGRATVRDGVLRVYGAGVVLQVHLGALQVVPCRVPYLDVVQRGDLLCKLEGLSLEGRLGLPADETLERVARVLSEGADTDELRQASISYLLGRGLGLTPSGDDVLVGYGIGLLMGGVGNEFCEAIAGEDLERTTDVSAAYLRATSEGYANQEFIELASGLKNGALVGGTIRRLLAVGHTSGADGLWGLELALRAELGGGCSAPRRIWHIRHVRQTM